MYQQKIKSKINMYIQEYQQPQTKEYYYSQLKYYLQSEDDTDFSIKIINFSRDNCFVTIKFEITIQQVFCSKNFFTESYCEGYIYNRCSNFKYQYTQERILSYIIVTTDINDNYNILDNENDYNQYYAIIKSKKMCCRKDFYFATENKPINSKRIVDQFFDKKTDCSDEWYDYNDELEDGYKVFTMEGIFYYFFELNKKYISSIAKQNINHELLYKVDSEEYLRIIARKLFSKLTNAEKLDIVRKQLLKTGSQIFAVKVFGDSHKCRTQNIVRYEGIEFMEDITNRFLA